MWIVLQYKVCVLSRSYVYGVNVVSVTIMNLTLQAMIFHKFQEGEFVNAEQFQNVILQTSTVFVPVMCSSLPPSTSIIL